MKWNAEDKIDSGPVEDGIYEFTISNALATTAQSSGNEMIELELTCDVGRNNPLKVYDRLISTPKALYRLENFCNCVGLDFNAGELTASACINLTGKAKLILGPPVEQGKNVGKRFMEVGDWVSQPAPETAAPKEEGDDSAIPY